MLYIAIFDAKEDTTVEEINRERGEWIKKGRDKVFERMCKCISRYEVTGISPKKIVFHIDTDDPRALNMIAQHFGDYWYCVTYPVIQRQIYEALEEDRTISEG
jgi:spore coat polysaccharide biosynthesis protein SpsF (cytidylyltransferase family)